MRRAWAFVLIASIACGDPAGSSDNPVPTLTRLNPASLVAGGPVRSVVLEGTGFTPQSMVVVASAAHDGVAIITSQRLRLTLADSEIGASGTMNLRVVNPAPGGGISDVQTLEIRAPTPTVTSLDEPQREAGQVLDTVIVRGTSFLRNSVVNVNGATRPTTWVNAETLAAILNEGDLDSAGVFDVSVTNPPPGGGTSNTRALTLVNPVPAITLLPSQGAHAGRGGFSLMIHGTGFIMGSTVQWNGADRPTQYVSGTRLMAEISASDVASPGTGNITVVNAAPAGGTSGPAVMTVRTVPTTDFSSVTWEGMSARDLAVDDQQGLIYMSISEIAPNDANSVIAINPLTTAITRRVFVGSQPGRIARSSNGQFLYVGLNGASAVRRVDLTAFAAGPQWSLSLGEIAGEIRVLPGHPFSVVVSRQKPGISPPLTAVTVYDNGVARTESGPGHTGGNRIEVLENPDTLYGFNNSHSGFEFFTISLDPTGARYAFTTGGLIAGYYTQITGASGRIYGTDGSIVDAERRTRIGSLPANSLSTAVDPVLGRAFLLFGDRIEVYDLNNFQLLGSFTIFNFTPGHPGGAYPHLSRWGTDGLAFIDTDRLFLVRSPMFGP